MLESAALEKDGLAEPTLVTVPMRCSGGPSPAEYGDNQVYLVSNTAEIAYASLLSFVHDLGPRSPAGVTPPGGTCELMRRGGRLRNHPPLDPAWATAVTREHGAESILVLSVHANWKCTNEGVQTEAGYLEAGFARCYESETTLVALLVDRQGRPLWKSRRSGTMGHPDQAPPQPSLGLAKLLEDVPLGRVVGFSPALAGSSAGSPQSPAAAGAVAVPERLLGEWVMAPPPHERRSVALARYALSTPPRDEAFEHMDPTPQEREHYLSVVRLRNEEPSSPLLAALRRKLDALEAVRVTFTATEFIATTPTGTTITRFSVEANLGDSIVLRSEGDGDPSRRRSRVDFVDEDSIVVTIGATRVPMNRVPPGVAPAPSTAPALAATPDTAPASDTTPQRSESATALEACAQEYYRCIEQMPAQTRAELEDVIAATRTIFRDAAAVPSRRAAALRSCRQAVDLAHSTYCRP